MTALVNVTRDRHVTSAVTQRVSHATPTPPHPTSTCDAAFSLTDQSPIKIKLRSVTRGRLNLIEATR